jgi:hypothetical protein
VNNLLDDARYLAENAPIYTTDLDGQSVYFCVHCDLGDPHWKAGGFKHAPDCPWLALPKIVAALEAAERTSKFDPWSDNGYIGTVWECFGCGVRGDDKTHAEDCPWQAFSAALRDEATP